MQSCSWLYVSSPTYLLRLCKDFALYIWFLICWSKRCKSFAVLVFLLANNTTLLAEEVDFTLPTLNGAQFVRLADVNRPTLVNFWGVDCPPCLLELPLLEKFAQEHTHWTVLLVATDRPSAVYDFLSRHPVTLRVLRPGADVAKLMRSLGNRIGALPFSLAVNQRGQVCFRKLGILKTEDLLYLQQACFKKPKSN